MSSLQVSILLSVALLAGLPASAQSRADLARCVALNNDLARLACFDNVASKAGLSTRPKKTQVGKWKVETSTSPVDDTKTIVASLAAVEQVQVGYRRTRPTMFARCQESQFSVFVVLDAFLGTDEIEVTHRFDSEPPVVELWSTSTDHSGAFAPSPEEFLSAMVDSSKLLFRMTPYSENTITFSLAVGGIERVIPEFFAHCRIRPVRPLFCIDGANRSVWGTNATSPQGTCSLEPWKPSPVIDGIFTVEGAFVDSLKMLGKIKQIRGNLVVSTTGLQDLSFLAENAHITGEVTIEKNGGLTSLVGAKSIAQIGGKLTFEENPEVDRCEALAWFERVAKTHGTKKLTELVSSDIPLTARTLGKCGLDQSYGVEAPPGVQFC